MANCKYRNESRCCTTGQWVPSSIPSHFFVLYRRTSEKFVLMHQQAYIHMKCLPVLFSPVIITVPEQKDSRLLTGAVVISPWVGIVVN